LLPHFLISFHSVTEGISHVVRSLLSIADLSSWIIPADQ